MTKGSNWHAHMLARAEEAAHDLQGTCSTLIEKGYEEESDDRVFCGRLDELVFECTECNWWCEQSEMAENPDDEWICQECFDAR